MGRVGSVAVGVVLSAKKNIDADVVFKLAAMAATDEEIADVAGVARSVFYSKKASGAKVYKNPETEEMMTLAELISAGRSQGRVSLRRAQFKAALEGNVTAMIWLGKQWLGQKESPLEISGKVDMEEKASMGTLNVDELNQLYRLRKKMEQIGSADSTPSASTPASAAVVDVTKVQ